MRAATLTSLAVLGLSTAALASVDIDGQHSRRHRASDAAMNTMNSTDLPSTNAATSPDTVTPVMTNTTDPGASTMNNGM